MIQASVIIATYNRVERLRACLQAFCEQTQPADDFEVIVVVDGSTDGTREMLVSFQAPYALRRIDQRNQGQSVALNHGAAAAAGGICIFTDDDIVVGPTFVSDHLRLHSARERMVGIGQMTLKLPSGADWYAQCHARIWREHYAELNQATRQPNWEDCYGGNMSVDRAAFLHVGGFALDLVRGYDIELAYRLAQSGYSFAYLPDALGEQDERKGLEALARESEKSGAGCVGLFKRYPPLLGLIGAFPEQQPVWALSWRILMSLNVSPGNLERARRLLGNRAANTDGYRFIKQYAFWKGVRRAISDQDTWNRLTSGVPVLMYHAFGSAGEAPSRFVVPARRFAMQMNCLKRMGYHVLGLEEFLHYRLEHRLPPARSVVITIDDGYMDTWSVAYPILRRLNFSATVFLVTGKIGEANDWDVQSELAKRPLLAWSGIHEMIQGGIQFGAHTRTHPDLTTCSLEQAKEEITGSRSDLETRLGVPVRVLAFPYGRYNTMIQAIADQAGFVGGCGIHEGSNTPITPLISLRRVEIRGTDSMFQFLHALRYSTRRDSWIRRQKPAHVLVAAGGEKARLGK